MNRGNAVKTGGAGLIFVMLAASLTGCFGNPIEKIKEEAAKKVAEKVIEDGTGGDVDVELGGSLPDGFPEAVPLIDAKIKTAVRAGQSSEGTAWLVVFETNDPQSAFDQSLQLLTDAGFVETMSLDDEQTLMHSLEKEPYGVTVFGYLDDASISVHVQDASTPKS
ncbi:hypothetical protein ACFPJ2_13330 [Microbacterium suwonense]